MVRQSGGRHCPKEARGKGTEARSGHQNFDRVACPMHRERVQAGEIKETVPRLTKRKRLD